MKARRLAMPPKGAFCTHRRMRYVACAACAPRGPCAVECPGCGLGWQLYEDLHGYYDAWRHK